MSKSNTKPKILFIMTGSIACYKACHILSLLIKNNYDVEVVMTHSAAQFVGAATIEGLTRKSPHVDLFASGTVMEHIHLIRWADLVIVAPATANYINKIAKGLGEDLASTLYLAHDFKKPFLIAPAMNTSMYLHPETQKSIQHLKDLGLKILDTESGVLACGENGWGRLLEPELIFSAIEKNLSTATQLQSEKTNKALNITGPEIKTNKVLILAGGTAEPIDQVRAITNTSTGATGAQLADFLFEMGLEVCLVTSEKAQMPQAPIAIQTYFSFQDLQKICETLDDSYDVIINLAAISDFSIEKIYKKNLLTGQQREAEKNQKVSSDLDNNEKLIIELKQNPKLLKNLREKFPKSLLIGFKLTTEHSLSSKLKTTLTDLSAAPPEAVQKVLSSGADYVIHNDLTDIKQGHRYFDIYGHMNRPLQKQTAHSITDLAALVQQLILIGRKSA